MIEKPIFEFRRSAIRGVSLAFVSLSLVIDQSTATSVSGKMPPIQQNTTAVPIPILYKHFFAHVRQLDNEADQLDKSGKNGGKYRQYYQQQLGFSDAQFNYVRTAAHNTQQADNIDQKAKQIIVEFRKKIAEGSTANDGSLPPIPQELRDLKIQRDQLLSSQIAQLKQQLGPKASETLDHLIQTSFTSRVSMPPVIAPSRQQLKGRNLTLPPLDTEPRH